MRKSIILVATLAISSTASAEGFCWRNQAINGLCHATISSASALVANEIFPNDPGYAFGLAMVPGVLKELSDKQRGKRIDPKDLAMDALGAGLTLVAIKIGNGTLTFSPQSIRYDLQFGN